jgi:RimJ/RimL family protein N-acetyltransferase
MPDYILQTVRLGMRIWHQDDLEPFAKMNKDPVVMKYFPRVFTVEESADGLRGFNNHFDDHGFTYYAVDLLTTTRFVGFIGLRVQSFESHFTPCVDIGWRLCVQAWGQGLATEGAKACLEHGFSSLQIDSIYSMAPAVNQRSINVMQKIGMTFVEEFEHPRLKAESPLRRCHLYRSDAATWMT